MMVTLFDLEDGTTRESVVEASEIEDVIAGFERRAPFFFELHGQLDVKLLVGFGANGSCAQFSASNGAPPYSMAIDVQCSERDGVMKFLINEPTEVRARYRLRRETLLEVVRAFLARGEKYSGCTWEDI